MAAARAILITGATGKQGGSVVDALLKVNAPFEIVALTRDAHSSTSRRLLQKSPNIKLVTGNLDSVDEIFRSIKEATKSPIWAVFSVQAVGRHEESQGKSLVDISVKHGVSHFIFSTADRGGAKSDRDPTTVPHFITKYNAEQHLFAEAKKSNMTWTVLRPVAFFDNLVPGFFGKVFTTSWAMRLRNDQKLQLIATSDIGTFAAQAFLNHDSERYRNKCISLAGDEMTFNQFKEIFESTTGEPLPTTYEYLAGLLNMVSKELGYMFKWFHDVGFGASVEECRKVNPEIKDFKEWLETESSWK